MLMRACRELVPSAEYQQLSQLGLPQNCSHSASLSHPDGRGKTKSTFYIYCVHGYKSLVVNFNTILGNTGLVQLPPIGNFIRNYFITHIIKLRIFNMSKVSSLILQNRWNQGLLPSLIQHLSKDGPGMHRDMWLT